MKNLYKIFLTVLLLLAGSKSFAGMSGTVTVGTGGIYTTFTGFNGLFSNISILGLDGDLTVLVVGNTIEPGSYYLNPIAGNHSIFITPSSSTDYYISGTENSYPVMTINGADNLYIEGSFNGSGQHLIFSSYNQNPAATQPCMLLQNDSKRIAVRNCIFKSNAADEQNSSLVFGLTSQPEGNDSVYINNCRFEGVNSERYVTAIFNKYSTSTPVPSNSSIGITKNSFTKFRSRGVSEVGAVVKMDYNGSNIYIDSNYFYNDSAIGAIQLIDFFGAVGSSNNSFSYNSMGGSSSDRSGAPLLFDGLIYTLMNIYTPGTGNIIKGNKMSNIAASDAGTGTGMTGIYFRGNCDISENIFGGASPWDTIHTSGYSRMILCSGSASLINCFNNTISNISYYRKKADGILGIDVGTAHEMNIFNNTITNLKSNASGLFTSSHMCGISFGNTDNNSTTNIYGNTISNFLQFTDTTIVNQFSCLYNAGSNSTCTANVYNNKIFNIRSTNANTGANAMVIYGILDNSPSGVANYYNNAISLETNNNTEAKLIGIGTSSSFMNGVGNHNFNYNSVYIGGNAEPGTTNISFAFLRLGIGPVILRNNIFCCNRPNQTCYAMGIQNSTNWKDTSSNYNLYISNTTDVVSFNSLTAPSSLSGLQSVSGGDYSSMGESSAQIVPSNLWNNTSNATLSINSSKEEAWYAFGQGTQITYPPISSDIFGAFRTSSLGTAPTTIGCAESSNPTSAPPIITVTILSPFIKSFLLAGKPVASIYFNNADNFPFDVSLRHFGGRTPPGAGVQQYSAMYDSIWISSGTPGNFTYQLYLYAYSNQQFNIFNTSHTRIAKSTDGGVGYAPQLVNGNYFSGSNTLPGYATATGLNSFSIFTLTSTDSPLPVELSSFTSSVDKNKVTLNWSTVTEINNAGFDIERKTLGSNAWTKIGYAAGHGTTSFTSSYKFTESISGTGKYNYRLKQLNNNGNFKYYDLSNLVEVGIPDKYSLSQNYPNPFNPATKINYDLPFDSKVSVKLFDITGRQVAEIVNANQTAGYYTILFNASSLSSGTYFYNISAESGSNKFNSTKKMVFVK